MCTLALSQLLYRFRLEAVVQAAISADKPSTSTLAISVSRWAACASAMVRLFAPAG
jgi:hypothetical protein